MQNTAYMDPTFINVDETNKQATWYLLWLKNWNYSHWLITSTISTLILSELGAIVLSAYPSLLTNLWLSLGITSSLSIAILSGTGIISMGLMTGWLIYASHLAYQSFTSVQVDYEPLIKLWSSNHQPYGSILKKLIENNNFLALSRYIIKYPGAHRLNDYLQDPQNIESARKILILLDKIWSTERIDQQIKMVIIHLLSEHITTEEAEEHINNIHTLCEILWQNEELNHELIVKVFQNSSLLKPYLTELQALADNPEVFKKCIEEPSLIPFQLANQCLDQSETLETLYPYLKQDERSNVSSLEQPGPIAPQIYQILRSHHGQTPEFFIQIWDKLIQHPHLAMIEPLIQNLSYSPDGLALLANKDALDALLNLFNTPNESLDDLFINFEILTEIILRLHALASFSAQQVEHIVLEKPLSMSLTFLKVYQSKIHQAESPLEQDLDKLLIKNQAIIDLSSDLNPLSTNYLQDLHQIITNYFKKEPASAAAEKVEAPPAPAKRRNAYHKLLKMLNMKAPKKTQALPANELHEAPEVMQEAAEARLSPSNDGEMAEEKGFQPAEVTQGLSVTLPPKPRIEPELLGTFDDAATADEKKSATVHTRLRSFSMRRPSFFNTSESINSAPKPKQSLS